MKRTVITKEIGAEKVIVGFGYAVANPEKTKVNIQPILSSSPEFEAIKAKQVQIEERMQLAASSIHAARISTKDTDKKLKHAQFLNHLSIAEELTNNELIPLNNAIKAKEKELWHSDSVEYFEPKKGEFIILDAEFEALSIQIKSLNDNKVLAFNEETKIGSIIDNLIGQIYWIDNSGTLEKGIVEQIGVALPDGAIKQKDLTEVQQLAISEQLEDARVAGLTQAEKDAEKEQAISNVTAQSVALRSQYEIEGQTSAEALTSAQSWLDAKIVLIEAKYV